LLFEAETDFTAFVHGEPFAQADCLRCHFLKLNKFQSELHFFIFGANPAKAHDDVRHVVMGKDKTSDQVDQVLFHSVEDLHFNHRLIKPDQGAIQNA